MAYEEKKAPAQAMPHRLTLDERSRLLVSGVEEVVSFHEEEVVVKTVRGTLVVKGENLRVDKLEKSSGELTVSGLVTELLYEESGAGTGFFSRLLR